jgi:prepilin-type N-terminal cleavage/methylation domain-containing protein
MQQETSEMMKKSAQGFTLIELAVVISIVAILAAVAVPRLMGNQAAAEEALARDFVSQLNSAAAMYTAQNSTAPTGFTQFVKSTALANGDTQTISVAIFGPNSRNGQTCNVADAQITCANAFNNLSTATYSWNNGAITANIVKR